MGLYFRFVLKTVLMTQECLAKCLATADECLYNVNALSASHPTPPASKLGVCKQLGGDTAGAADPD